MGCGQKWGSVAVGRWRVSGNQQLQAICTTMHSKHEPQQLQVTCTPMHSKHEPQQTQATNKLMFASNTSHPITYAHNKHEPSTNLCSQPTRATTAA